MSTVTRRIGRGTRNAPAGAQKPTPRSDAQSSGGKPDRILRFRRAEVLLHWAIAAPFLVCYLSSFVLVAFYTAAPERAGRPFFAWTHRISGLGLLILPSLVILTHRNSWQLLWNNVKQGWIWSIRDIRWLFLMGLSVMNKRIQLPEQGKFNAGEKLNFMMVMTTCPLFILTGLLIWMPGVAFYSWLAHFCMALAATPLMFGHIFMATINPETRVGITGMISGYVDRAWAKHHYPLWYAENFKEGAKGGRAASLQKGPAAPAPSDMPAGLEAAPQSTPEVEASTTASPGDGARRL